MADDTIVVRLEAEAKQFNDTMGKALVQTENLQAGFKTMAKISAATFTALAGGAIVATKKYADFEKGLIGVGKTTNLANKELKSLGKDIQDLSRKIPTATRELLDIGQSAGQLGVTGSKNILKFAATIAKLGSASDLSGDEAAVTLTRILNVSQEGIGTIDQFASTIVALGNSFAASESEIARMTNEVALSSAGFKVSSAEAAAIGTALRAVGVQARIGGTAIGKTFRQINKAVNNGGKEFEQLLKITGKTAKEFKEVFAKNSTDALALFINGLKKIPAKQVTAELAKFGLVGEGIAKTLPALVGASEGLNETLKVARKEYKANTALAKEFAAASASLDAKFQIFNNTLEVAAQRMGESFAPAALAVIEELTFMADKFNDLDSKQLDAIASGIKAAAAIAGVATATALTAITVLSLIGLVNSLTIALGLATAGALGLGTVLTAGLLPVVIAIAAFMPEIIKSFKAFSELAFGKEPPRALELVNRELKEANEELETFSKSFGAVGAGGKKQVESIKERIKLLKEETIEVKRRNSENLLNTFGTNRKPLIFPVELINDQKQEFNYQNTLDIFEQEAKAGQPISIPFRLDRDIEDPKDAVEAPDTTDNKEVVKGVKERIEIAKLEQTLAEARIREANATEIKLIETQIAQKKALLAANAIENDAVRAAEVQKVMAQNELLLEQLDLFAEEERVKKDERLKNLALLEQEQRDLNLEAKDLGTDIERQKLAEQLQTEDEMRAAANREIVLDNQKKNKDLIKDQEKHGKLVATLNQISNSSEMANAEEAAGQLVQLQKSKHKKQREIGKAAAHAQAAMDTAKGAIAAYSSLAGIPFVGPFLGAAAAGAVIAFGVEQQENINKAQDGGVIANLNGGSNLRDSQPAFLQPGELVTPTRNFDEVVNSVADSRNEEAGSSSRESGTTEVMISLKDNLGDFIEAQILERRAIGTGSI